MSSTFKTISSNTIRGFAGKEYEVPFYLQFVHGYVVDVVHSSESYRYNGDQTINTIIALPWVQKKTMQMRNIATEESVLAMAA